jgi:hypothetical protein
MGLQGVAEIDRFVNQGGVLITLGVSSFLPPDFGITRTVDAARTTPQFYAPGPIVEAEILRPTASDFLRLYAESAAGAMGQWTAAAGHDGAAARHRADAIPRHG